MPEKGSCVQDSFLLAGVVLLAFIVSVPCGYLRESFRKFSPLWFLMVHLPIPLVVLLRMKAGFSWHVAPITLSAAVAGQMLGGWYKRRMKRVRKAQKRKA